MRNEGQGLRTSSIALNPSLQIRKRDYRPSTWRESSRRKGHDSDRVKRAVEIDLSFLAALARIRGASGSAVQRVRSCSRSPYRPVRARAAAKALILRQQATLFVEDRDGCCVDSESLMQFVERSRVQSPASEQSGFQEDRSFSAGPVLPCLVSQGAKVPATVASSYARRLQVGTYTTTGPAITADHRSSGYDARSPQNVRMQSRHYNGRAQNDQANLGPANAIQNPTTTAGSHLRRTRRRPSRPGPGGATGQSRCRPGSARAPQFREQVIRWPRECSDDR